MDDHYDVALNADSMTEMTPETARTYHNHVERQAKVFLSINHEGNRVLAHDLFCTSTTFSRAILDAYGLC